ncbi:hypothetical protein DFH09DRAFT_859419, partial [Mycena vulgaris]
QIGSAPVPLTYIAQSSDWALDSFYSPDIPDGYELVFRPTGGVNNVPWVTVIPLRPLLTRLQYMGRTFLDSYDVDASATFYNTRGADPVGGIGEFFNIWCAVISSVPTTYTCSM